MAKGKNVLTTGEVAKICNVAPRTVSKWFDTGQLKGYRIPGSRDRRIPLNELKRFMKEYDIPAAISLTDKTRVLVVDSKDAALSALADTLSTEAEYEVLTVCGNFETGLAMQRFAPHVLLINLLTGSIDATDICKNIRANKDLQKIKVIALVNGLSNSESTALLQKGFDDWISDPSNVTEVIKKIKQATTTN